MKINLVNLLLVIILFSSCTKKYEIYLFNDEFKESTIVIDEDTISLDINKSFTLITLPEGEHTILSNGVLPNQVLVNSDGIICSGKREFMTFPMKFVADNSLKNMDFSSSSSGPMVIGDSLVVYDKYNNQTELISGMKRIIDLKVFNPSGKKLTPSLRILPQKDGMISKTWNYQIQDVPSTIEVKKDGLTELVGKNMKVVMEINDFLYYNKIANQFKVEKIESQELLETVNAYLNKEY